MSREYKILEDENKAWIFVDKHSHWPSEYISYRHVIAQAIHCFRRFPNNGAKIYIDEFKKAWDSLAYSWEGEESFLKIYWILTQENGNSKKYAVIIDKTHGCYPLVLDSDERVKAFNNSLTDIVNNFDKVIDILKLEERWTETLQNKLEEIYQFNTKL